MNCAHIFTSSHGKQKKSDSLQEGWQATIPPDNSPDTGEVANDILAATQGPLGLAGQDTTSLQSLSNPANSNVVVCGSLKVVNGMDVEDNVTSSGEDEDSNPSFDAEEDGV